MMNRPSNDAIALRTAGTFLIAALATPVILSGTPSETFGNAFNPTIFVVQCTIPGAGASAVLVFVLSHIVRPTPAGKSRIVYYLAVAVAGGVIGTILEFFTMIVVLLEGLKLGHL